MPELGRAALVVSLGLIVYALVAGAVAAVTRRRRLAVSAQNALTAAFGSTLVASVGAPCLAGAAASQVGQRWRQRLTARARDQGGWRS